jgi:(p)ppGpp synthase/HD superfamily hydrolase
MDLEQAIELAAVAHRGQVDKAGKPYILHPLRVMQHCAPDLDAMIVGVLHDTIEDTFVTEELLLEKGLAPHLVDAIHLLTRRPEDTYKEFVERLAHNRIARRVKIKDLEDNMSKERNPPPVSEKIAKRLLKYRRAHAYLYSVIMDETSGLPIGTAYKALEEL